MKDIGISGKRASARQKRQRAGRGAYRLNLLKNHCVGSGDRGQRYRKSAHIRRVQRQRAVRAYLAAAAAGAQKSAFGSGKATTFMATFQRQCGVMACGACADMRWRR